MSLKKELGVICKEKYKTPSGVDLFSCHPIGPSSAILSVPSEVAIDKTDSKINGIKKDLNWMTIFRDMSVKIAVKCKKNSIPELGQKVLQSRYNLNIARKIIETQEKCVDLSKFEKRIVEELSDFYSVHIKSGWLDASYGYYYQGLKVANMLPGLCEMLTSQDLPILLEYHKTNRKKCLGIGGEIKAICSKCGSYPSISEMGFNKNLFNEWLTSDRKTKWDIGLMDSYIKGQNIGSGINCCAVSIFSLSLCLMSGGSLTIFAGGAIIASLMETVTKILTRLRKNKIIVDIKTDETIGGDVKKQRIEQTERFYNRISNIFQTIFVVINLGLGLVDLGEILISAGAIISAIKLGVKAICKSKALYTTENAQTICKLGGNVEALQADARMLKKKLTKS